MDPIQEQSGASYRPGTQRKDSSTKGRKRTFHSSEQASTHKRPREEARALSQNTEGTPRRPAQWVQSKAATSPNTPQRSTGPAERLLGGSAVKASALAGQTPLRLKETTQLLPSSHALLVDIFGKLQTVYLLYKRRQQRCTFQNAKKPVEESCGRLFTMKHLLQLKEVVPDALQLSISAVARTQMPGSASKPEAQVLIDMPLLTAAGGTVQELRQLLADRLLERVRNHFQAQHPGGGQIKERDLETVPEVPQAELPAAAEIPPSLPALGSPVVPSPATPATGAVRPTPRSSLRKPPTGPPTARVMVKRLSFGGLQPSGPAEAGGAAGRSEPASWGANILDDDPEAAIAGGLAKKMRRESMDGTLPVSLQALQAVQQHAGEQAAAFTTEAVAARKQSIAAASLTRTFDALRALFGPAGSAVRPHTQVMRDLLGARAGTEQQQELDGQIDLLLEIVPEYLIREVREQGPVLRINRSLDAKAVREKLVNHVLDSTCT